MIQSYDGNEGARNARVAVNTIPSTSVAQNYNVSLAVGAGVAANPSVTFDPFGRVLITAPVAFTRIDIMMNPAIAAAGTRRLVISITSGGQVRLCDPQLALATNPQGCQ